jgi:hypothetical protein
MVMRETPALRATESMVNASMPRGALNNARAASTILARVSSAEACRACIR